MMKCPYCQFDNEDGALFCEQCKSDLGVSEPAPLSGSPAGMEPSPFLAVAAEAPAGEPLAVAEPLPPGSAFAAAAAVAVALPEPPPTVPNGPTLAAGKLPTGAEPRLLVIRGQKMNVEYPIYPGQNFIGRFDEKPVDIDLEDQEPADRILCSRQHALITLENDALVIEDLNSSNGTYVNRVRVYPGQKRELQVNDTIQIGIVQLRVKV